MILFTHIDTTDNMEEKINNDPNYWKEANDFIKTFVPEDIQKRFIAFCKERNYNRNEMMYFKILVGEALEFEGTMAILKNDCSQENTDPIAKSNEKDSGK